MTQSMLWYDLETTGTQPGSDRIYQFAAWRTDLELNPIDEPINWLCQPEIDVLPALPACLITGLEPHDLQQEGRPAPAFFEAIAEQMLRPGTCSAGYNSLRFDDEFIRHSFYRHFHDPYGREWRNGNSRWDIIDLARMCYALRPEGIEWPRGEDGLVSFKLEDLAAANGLAHQKAHDALSDVEATIGLARLIRDKQAKLYHFFFQLRSKQFARRYLPLQDTAPLLHVSSRYPRDRACLAMVLPVAAHPKNGNAVLVYDLQAEPSDLIEADAEELEDLLFTPSSDLPDDRQRLAVKTVQINKCPALAPMNVLREGDAARTGLDIERCHEHARRILQHGPTISEKLRQVFGRHAFEPSPDPERQLYDGFIDDEDRLRFDSVRNASAEFLANFQFKDERLNALLFRYRARFFSDSLTASEQQQWHTLLQRRLFDGSEGNGVTFDRLQADIEQWRTHSEPGNPQWAMVDRLEAWVKRHRERIETLIQSKN